MIVIDGKDAILGRLASFVAKKLLEGEKVAIVNAEQVVISGKKESTLGIYKDWLETRNVANPRKGPFHPRRPEEIVRRAIRGMLPFSTARGRNAYRRLRAYVGVPDELSKSELVSVPDAGLGRLRSRRFIRVGELSERLGATL